MQMKIWPLVSEMECDAKWQVEYKKNIQNKKIKKQL